MKLLYAVLFAAVYVLPMPAKSMELAHLDSLKVEQRYSALHDKWFAEDKAKHLVSSAFLVGLGYYAARQELEQHHQNSIKVAIGVSFSLGIVKEIYDLRIKRTRFSLKDVAADLAGICIGVLFLNAN